MSKKSILNLTISLILLFGFLPVPVGAQPNQAPELLLISNLVYTGPASGDSGTTVTLSAVLTDEFGVPVVGRPIGFSLGGLPAVAGVTDGTGEASADLELAIAPGNHTLSVAFNGDDVYDPVSTQEPFEVTSPWSAWVQDSQADFEANTLIDLDTATQPGGVQLAAQITGGGERTGPFHLPCQRECGGFVDFPEDTWWCHDPCVCPGWPYDYWSRWHQTDWSGGPGQELLVDETRFLSSTNIDFTQGDIRVSEDVAGEVFFLDDFTRPEPPPYSLAPWIQHSGTWTITEDLVQPLLDFDFILEGTSPVGEYGLVYIDSVWVDYSVEGFVNRIFPDGSTGGGIGGRLDPATGAHYAALIFGAGGPFPGSKEVRLIKFHDWNTWSGTPMAEVSFDGSTPIDEFELLKMDFEGNVIRVYVNGELLINVTDDNYEGIPAYLSGGVGVGFLNNGPSDSVRVNGIVVGNLSEPPYTGTLLSSAFDGGEGVDWGQIGWSGSQGWPPSSSAPYRIRTRTADQVDQLPTAPWSDWYTYRLVCGFIECNYFRPDIASEDLRYIQYEVEVTSESILETTYLDFVSIDFLGGEYIWHYRHRLDVENNSPEGMPAGYSVRLVLDTETLVNEGKLQPDGRDLRLVYDYYAGMEAIDYLITTPFNTPDTEIWFRTREPIPASGQDGDYYLYYGNPAAGPPPQDPAGVWALWDEFEGAALDPSVWDNPAGSVTVSGGLAQLTVGASLIATRTLTNTLMEMRVQLGAEDDEAGWGMAETPTNPDNLILFQESPGGFEARTLDDASSWPNYTSYPLSDPQPGGLTEWHTYTIDWRGGNASWLVDGSEVASSSANVPDSGLYALFNAAGVPLNVDWVRSRLLVEPEPVVSLATSDQGYVDQGMMLSIPFDTGQYSSWKYLTWEAYQPADTDVHLQVRTAATQGELDSAPWVDYPESGAQVTNDPGRWIQYQATLSTTEFHNTPVLDQVSIYYDEFAGMFAIAPQSATVIAGEAIVFTASLDDGSDVIDVTAETTFTIEPSAGGSWVDNVYTSQNIGTWTVTGQYAGHSDLASLTVNPLAEPTCVTIQRDTYGQVVDGYIWESAPSAYFATAGSLSTGVRDHRRLGPGETRSLLHFDLDFLPAEASVQSASLGLSVTGGGSGETISIYRVTESWSEDSSLTWANLADSYDGSVAWGSFLVTGGSVTAELSGLVSAWANGSFANQGLMMINTSGSSRDIYKSSEFSDISQHPWLEVCYLEAFGPPVSIEVTPDHASIIRGESIAYVATAQDAMGNTWDVTGGTAFSIDPGAGGSWVANTYTSQNAGTWTVTGQHDGLTDTTSLTVAEHGTAISIEVSPDSAAVTAGETAAYQATAQDALGNTWDVTPDTTFGIDAGAGGTWLDNVYTSEFAGDWTVTGDYNGLTDTASLSVDHGVAASIEITPDSMTIMAGESIYYFASAVDAYGNTWDVTMETIFSIEAGAGGSWSGNNYTSENAGVWSVTGDYNALVDTATLTVEEHGPATALSLSPDSSSLVAGESQIFTATAEDAYGNTWDVTVETNFAIEASAGGTWLANEYTCEFAGTWTVTGEYLDLTDTVALTVQPGPPVSLEISPVETTIVAGGSVNYQASAEDAYSNGYDVTSLTYWSIESGAGGGWVANVYTSENPGDWTVTGEYEGQAGTATLHVTPSGEPTCVVIQRDIYGQVLDGYIWEVLPNASYFSAYSLSTGDRNHYVLGPGETRSLLQFDLGFLPAGALVDSATLGLSVSGGGSGATISIYRVSEPWNEDSGLTWSNQADNFDNSVTWGSFVAAGGTATVDLGGLVAEWVNGTYANEGLMMINTSGTTRDTFKSSDFFDVDRRPWLEVCYLTP